jgi:hypothetical protein
VAALVLDQQQRGGRLRPQPAHEGVEGHAVLVGVEQQPPLLALVRRQAWDRRPGCIQVLVTTWCIRCGRRVQCMSQQPAAKRPCFLTEHHHRPTLVLPSLCKCCRQTNPKPQGDPPADSNHTHSGCSSPSAGEHKPHPSCGHCQPLVRGCGTLPTASCRSCCCAGLPRPAADGPAAESLGLRPTPASRDVSMWCTAGTCPSVTGHMKGVILSN